MADISPSLCNGILPRLGIESAFSDGFRGWILSGSFQLGEPVEDVVLSLEVSDLDKFVRYSAFDYERFALSSRESLVVALSEFNRHRLPSWPLLKLYYSGFFAAHSIMRSQGGGMVKIEREHAMYLNSLVQLSHYGYSPIQPGMYLYKFDGVSRNSRVLLSTAVGCGGVHESFWKIFCQFLEDEARDSLEVGAANSTDYFDGALEVKEAILGLSSGYRSWYSKIRNEINYQHKHATWFPVRRRSPVLRLFQSQQPCVSKNLQLMFGQNRDPVSCFSTVSRFLAYLNCEVAEQIAARSTRGGAFGQKWRRLNACANSSQSSETPV